ncbi:MAG: hypothetical protein ACI89A_000497 [Porticoccaceae bacterium]|jgi:hypothetical protein
MTMAYNEKPTQNDSTPTNAVPILIYLTPLIRVIRLVTLYLQKLNLSIANN